MYDFLEFLSACHSVTRDEFLQCFPLPLLLIEKYVEDGPQDQGLNLALFDTRQTQKRLITTELASDLFNRFKGREHGSHPGKLARIFDFQKARRRLMMISIGRSSTNIICLNDNSISKFHAYFRKESDSWVLVDAESFNGTIVNGRHLSKQMPQRIQNGDGIRFGSVYYATFFTSEGFYLYASSLNRSHRSKHSSSI